MPRMMRSGAASTATTAVEVRNMNTIQIGPRQRRAAEEEKAVPRQSMNLNQAATKIQSIFRGHRSRRGSTVSSKRGGKRSKASKPKGSAGDASSLYDIIRWRAKTKRKVIEPLGVLEQYHQAQRKKKGFKALCIYVVFLTLFFLMINTQNPVEEMFTFEHSIVQDLEDVTFSSYKTYKDIGSGDDVWRWAEAWLIASYAGSTLDAVTPINEAPPALDSSVQDTVEAEIPQLLETALGRAPTSQELNDLEPEIRALYQFLRGGLLLDADYDCFDAGTIAPLYRYEALWVAGELLLLERQQVAGSLHPDVAHTGYTRGYNRYFGGLYVSQARRAVETCDYPEFAEFYDTCYTDDVSDTSAFPGYTTGRSYSPTPSMLTFNELFDVGTIGYGRRHGQCKMSLLRRDKWLNRGSATATVHWALYNGNLNRLGHIGTAFSFDLGGEVAATLSLASVAVSGSGAQFLTAVNFVFIVLFYAFVAGYLAYEVALAVRITRQTGSICTYFTSFWHLLDLVGHGNFLAQAVLSAFIVAYSSDVSLVSADALSGRDAAVASSLTTLEDVDAITQLQDWYRILISFSVYVSLLRLFKFFRFHHRISVLTATLERAWVELAHFAIMMSVVVGMFSAMGLNFLGTRSYYFHTFTRAAETLLLIAIGEIRYYDFIAISPFMATVFFWSYVIIVGLLLMNVFLSIIVEAFMAVRQESEHDESIWTSLFVFLGPYTQKALSCCCKGRKKKKSNNSVTPDKYQVLDIGAAPLEHRDGLLPQSIKAKVVDMQRAAAAASLFGEAVSISETLQNTHLVQGDKELRKFVRTALKDRNGNARPAKPLGTVAPRLKSKKQRKTKSKKEAVSRLTASWKELDDRLGGLEHPITFEELKFVLSSIPEHQLLELLHYFGQTPREPVEGAAERSLPMLNALIQQQQQMNEKLEALSTALQLSSTPSQLSSTPSHSSRSSSQRSPRRDASEVKDADRGQSLPMSAVTVTAGGPSYPSRMVSSRRRSNMSSTGHARLSVSSTGMPGATIPGSVI